MALGKCLGLVIFEGGLIASVDPIIVDRQRVMLRASEDRCLTRTGDLRAAIRRRNCTRAFSSGEVRYCWFWALALNEGRPCSSYHRVVRGTPLRFARVA
jgi:hypothetical protein